MDESSLAKDLDRTIGTSWREEPLFDLGLVLCTPGAFEAAQAAQLPDLHKPFGGSWRPYLERHRRADWPDLPEEDRQLNLSSLENGARIFGAYTLPNTGQKIWIITEAEIQSADGWRHRPSTTILLPEDSL